MTRFTAAVIGGGHAGIEAVNILNRLDVHTVLITPDIDKIGYASCNPSIGGIGKSHLVYELDALGGLMPLASDYAGIHYKLLNRSKGPAVWSLRAQIDMAMYVDYMRKAVQSMKNVEICEEMAESLIIENNTVKGVIASGSTINADIIIITAGTFLRGMMHIGGDEEQGGRAGEQASVRLSDSILSAGIRMGRLKTGTSPRVYRDSIDFDSMEIQESEEKTGTFSIENREREPRAVCHITRTNSETHHIIEQNLQKSALYGGKITGKGPRYCPSIEDKIVRFDRPSHTVFIEPTGIDSQLYYINGLSTSLPVQSQELMLHSVKGLERARIAVPGYAIEYDFIYPEQLTPSLQSRHIKGLYFAGQVNGTSGYEEAAAQGFAAGLSAGLSVLGRENVEFARHDSYTGVLIDDLMKRDISEPYRLFTSRAENRLLLRQDNAFYRMKAYLQKAGLQEKKQYQELHEETERLMDESMKDGKPYGRFSCFTDPSRRFEEFEEIAEGYSYRAQLYIYSMMKYSGYVKRSERISGKMKKYGNTKIDWQELAGLKIISKEARTLIEKHKPENISMLHSIIDPTDIENIIIYLQRKSTD